SKVLYGSQYDDAELDEWAGRIRGWLADGADVYVYFDNDYKAFAAEDAERLIRRVDPAWAPRPLAPSTRGPRSRPSSRAGSRDAAGERRGAMPAIAPRGRGS